MLVETWGQTAREGYFPMNTLSHDTRLIKNRFGRASVTAAADSVHMPRTARAGCKIGNAAAVRAKLRLKQCVMHSGQRSS